MLTFPPHHVISVKVGLQLNKTVYDMKFIVNLTRKDSQKRHILALCPSSVQKRTEECIVRISAVDASDEERLHLPKK